MRRCFSCCLFYFLSVFPVFAQETNVPVWWETVLGYTQLPVGRMQETLQAACDLITTKSLTPVTASQLAFASVKSLSTIDQKISVMKDGKRVLILADGKILKSFSAPADELDPIDTGRRDRSPPLFAKGAGCRRGGIFQYFPERGIGRH